MSPPVALLPRCWIGGSASKNVKRQCFVDDRVAQDFSFAALMQEHPGKPPAHNNILVALENIFSVGMYLTPERVKKAK